MCEGHVWIGWKPAEASQQIHKYKVLLSTPLVPTTILPYVNQREMKREGGGVQKEGQN